MQAVGADFVRTLFENLQTEKNELKQFLINLLADGDLSIQFPAKEWGD